MDISTITSVNQYLKTFRLKTQVKLRQESGDMTSHKKTLDEWISSQTRSVYELYRQDMQENDSQLQTIYTKLSCGKKLTSEEKSYLKAKNPMAYQKVLDSEQEQKNYEQELKRCRTKEDVQRLRLSHLNSSMVAVNGIKNNSHIPQATKLQLVSAELNKLAALERITQKFIKSGQYEKLPTDAEKAQAERIERDEDCPPPEAADEKRNEQQDVTAPEEADAEKMTRAEGDTGKVIRAETDATTPLEQELLRKTRFAKAKAAYVQTETTPEDLSLLLPIFSESTMDVQA